MSAVEVMEARHSVRKYLDKPIEIEKVQLLKEKVIEVNVESGLHFQLITDEPECFDINKTFYGKIANCKNYFVCAGTDNRDEDIGYFGEKLVLYAQELGLNTCWAGASYNKKSVSAELNEGEKIYIVIALGYGETQGHPRKSKTPQDVSDVKENSPQWYKDGIKAALNAPTAINQQRFSFKLKENTVKAKCGKFVYTKMDLGIVKLHFELGAGKDNFVWSK